MKKSLKSSRPAARRTAWLVPSLLLGGVMLGSPVLAGAATTSTTISSTLSSVISLLSSNGTVNANVTPTGSGAQTIASDTVTVSTNDASGYTLQLAETTGTGTLTSGGNTIPASSGTAASPVAMAVNTWGYRFDGLSGFGAGPTTAANSAAISGTIKFAAVPATASPVTLKTTSGTASNDTSTVWYGVAANTSQASGTYTNSVTYTVTAN
ncbi:MAG TPA: hypothetical protein VLF69_04725 [Candidatus Saccharimonadales bacterium]|nr:hypothetical protein [Candidatus Saccharimonadales bacterium]